MKQTIHTIPHTLLETYLDDLRTEAETVAHIVKFLNDSMTARAGLAARLEDALRDRHNRSPDTQAEVIEPENLTSNSVDSDSTAKKVA